MSIFGTFRAAWDRFVGASDLAPAPEAKAAAPPATRIVFRATDKFMSNVRADLHRSHPFAFERVGFIVVRAARSLEGIILLAQDYHPVADDDYVADKSVGAMIGQEALRKALDLALLRGVGVFHVHMHGPGPRLWFSSIDLREQSKFVPDFFSVCPQMPHGAIVLNANAAAGRVWISPTAVTTITAFEEVGDRLIFNRSASSGSTDYYA